MTSIINLARIYKSLNCNNSVNIKPREVILPSLDSSQQDESSRKEFVEIQLLNAEKILWSLYYLIVYKNHNNSVNINPREMILLSLDSSHQGESNRKKDYWNLITEYRDNRS